MPNNTKSILYAILILYIFKNVAGVLQDRLVFIRGGYNIDKCNFDLPIKEIIYKGYDGIDLYSWYIPHKQPLGIFIFFHGNAGSVSTWVKSVKNYYDWGYSIFMVEYRGFGKCPGTPTENDIYNDASSAYLYVNNILKYHPNKIILSGNSLGGAVAINLASEVSIAAVIVDSSFTSMPDMMNKIIPYLGYYICNFMFDSAQKIKKITAPVLIIHSKDDKLIPFEMGGELFRNANKSKKRVLFESKGGHINSIWNDNLTCKIRQFCSDSVITH